MSGHYGLMRHMLMGEVSRGRMPLVLGDAVGEMTRLVDTMGGQVIRLGAGDRINPLDVGDWVAVAEQLPTALAATVRDSVIETRVSIMTTLVGLVRGAPCSPEEMTVLVSAIFHITALEPSGGSTPEVGDIESLVREPTGRMRTALCWLEYPADLEQSLGQLVAGDLGDIAGPTTSPLDIDCAPAIAIDISAVPAGQQRAAALALAWGHGLALVDTAGHQSWVNDIPTRPLLAIYPDSDHHRAPGVATSRQRGLSSPAVPQ